MDTTENAFVQTPAEYRANIIEVENKLLKDHGARIAGTDMNGRRLADYMLKYHLRGDGKVNATATTMYNAVLNLHKVGMIDWAVPPKRLPDVQGLNKQQSPYGEATINAEMAAVARDTAQKGRNAAIRREAEAIKRVLYECERLTRSAYRPTFAKSAHLRADLTEMLQKGLKKNINLQEAKALLAKMTAYTDSDVHSVAGHLKTGW